MASFSGKASVLWDDEIRREALTQGHGNKPRSSSKRSAVETALPINPVDSVAAAYATSFSAALAKELGSKALANGKMSTTATITLKHFQKGTLGMNINLNVVAKLPKVTQSKFIDATVKAKTNCLVSKMLRGNIFMNAKLETN